MKQLPLVRTALAVGTLALLMAVPSAQAQIRGLESTIPLFLGRGQRVENGFANDAWVNVRYQMVWCESALHITYRIDPRMIHAGFAYNYLGKTYSWPGALPPVRTAPIVVGFSPAIPDFVLADPYANDEQELGACTGRQSVPIRRLVDLEVDRHKTLQFWANAYTLFGMQTAPPHRVRDFERRLREQYVSGVEEIKATRLALVDRYEEARADKARAAFDAERARATTEYQLRASIAAQERGPTANGATGTGRNGPAASRRGQDAAAKAAAASNDRRLATAGAANAPARGTQEPGDIDDALEKARRDRRPAGGSSRDEDIDAALARARARETSPSRQETQEACPAAPPGSYREWAARTLVRPGSVSGVALAGTYGTLTLDPDGTMSMSSPDGTSWVRGTWWLLGECGGKTSTLHHQGREHVPVLFQVTSASDPGYVGKWAEIASSIHQGRLHVGTTYWYDAK